MNWNRVYELIEEHKKYNYQLDNYIDECNEDEECGDGNIMGMYGHSIYKTEFQIQEQVNKLLKQYDY